MRRFVFLVLIFMVLSPAAVFSGDWVAKNPQGAGPKFGDFLKANPNAVKPFTSDKKNKHRKNKAQ